MVAWMKGVLFYLFVFTLITQTADEDWGDMICCLLECPSVNEAMDSWELNFYS